MNQHPFAELNQLLHFARAIANQFLKCRRRSLKRVNVTLMVLCVALLPKPSRAQSMYWMEILGEVKKANLDGSNVQTLFNLNEDGGGIAVDSQHGKLYFSAWRSNINAG